jgi:peptide chain release factor subunit 1
LSQYKSVPENGLIIFCGETIISNDKTTFEYICLTPPFPVKSFSYRCNSIFEIDDAEKLIQQNDTYALIVLDLHEACWGTVCGSNIAVLGSIDSIVPSKHSQGGQSAQRFERLRDIAINEFFVKLGERTSNSFGSLDLKGVLIGGCGMTKDEFMKGEYLNHEIRKKIIGSFDTAYTNEHGLFELVNASKDKLVGLKSIREKEILDEFLKLLAKDMEKVAYGTNAVLEKARTGQVKTAIIASNQNEIVSLMLPLSESMNFKIEIISENSDSGNILNSAFGGIVTILRYR